MTLYLLNGSSQPLVDWIHATKTPIVATSLPPFYSNCLEFIFIILFDLASCLPKIVVKLVIYLPSFTAYLKLTLLEWV